MIPISTWRASLSYPSAQTARVVALAASALEVYALAALAVVGTWHVLPLAARCVGVALLIAGVVPLLVAIAARARRRLPDPPPQPVATGTYWHRFQVVNGGTEVIDCGWDPEEELFAAPLPAPTPAILGRIGAVVAAIRGWILDRVDPPASTPAPPAADPIAPLALREWITGAFFAAWVAIFICYDGFAFATGADATVSQVWLGLDRSYWWLPYLIPLAAGILEVHVTIARIPSKGVGNRLAPLAELVGWSVAALVVGSLIGFFVLYQAPGVD